MAKIEDKTVLYLEDEPLVCMDTTYLLEDLGFKTVEATYTLATAARAASERNFDLAILDINVDRGQTSIELGKKLAANGTRVMFASGNSSKTQFALEGNFYWLDKPFSPTALSAAIDKILKG